MRLAMMAQPLPAAWCLMTLVASREDPRALARDKPDRAPSPQRSYPTTVTRISSSTLTEITPYNPVLPVPWYSKTVISTVTVTLLEPWPASPTSFPYTMLQTAVKHSTIESRLVVTISAPPETSFSYATVTGTSTWILWRPAVTDMPAGGSGSCSECVASSPTPDPRCERLGLDTACQGQCEQRDGLWWCYRRYYSDPSSLAMGRACWGNKTEYAQLLTPCIGTDHALPCMPCKGKDYAWNSVNWHWDV
ncbi:hypothetical protein GQ53DRAFT_832511 [Thozetella sp. PMI_491]|nr:hypothetical protein GQ53DRAFT_832511 [Thozetella sp. PMI_491]